MMTIWGKLGLWFADVIGADMVGRLISWVVHLFRIIFKKSSTGNDVANDTCRKYTITIVRKGNDLRISDTSFKKLKAILRNQYNAKVHRPIRIQLKARKIPDLAQALLGEYADGIPDSAKAVSAEQTFRINYQNNKELLETAADMLLANETLVIGGKLLETRYPQLGNADTGFFKDSRKILRSYSQAFLWKHILEEMLNCLLLNRFDEHMESDSLLAVVGTMENVGDFSYWYFTSFVSPESEHKRQDLCIMLKYRSCCYYDFADADKIDYILPDYFIKLARLKRKDKEKFERAAQGPRSILNLNYYEFGLH